MRVALYGRVSTQRQAQAQTVEQQLGRPRDHAQQNGWNAPTNQVFRDAGYSGASLKALLTNPAYTGTVYGNRWRRRGAVERRSAIASSKRSAWSRVDLPREAGVPVAEILPIVSQEQFDAVQARLASNRRPAQRNNKAHPQLLRSLVSRGLCGLDCLARATKQGQRCCSSTGKLPALFSHREQKCPSRLSPARRLDELVWTDLCTLLTQFDQIAQALGRAHGGHWPPQELQARQQGLRAWPVEPGTADQAFDRGLPGTCGVAE